MEKGQGAAIGIALGLGVVIVALAISRAESTWAVAVATIGLVFATLVLGRHSNELNHVTKALTQATQRMAQLAERAQVLEDIDMYQKIAEGNRWGWKPSDVDKGTSEYDKWDMWRQHCIESRPDILDTQLRTLLDEFIPMLTQQKVLDRWGVVFADVKLEAQRQISPLQERLKRVNELLAQGEK